MGRHTPRRADYGTLIRRGDRRCPRPRGARTGKGGEGSVQCERQATRQGGQPVGASHREPLEAIQPSRNAPGDTVGRDQPVPGELVIAHVDQGGAEDSQREHLFWSA
jgi:hypothetical protein